MPRDWIQLEIDFAADVAESAGSALIDAGAVGIEERPRDDDVVTLVAYFAERPDEDWLASWKRGFEPFPIGERLVVVPSWRRDEAYGFTERVAIEIDPGMAFGTGTHETTRLCLEW